MNGLTGIDTNFVSAVVVTYNPDLPELWRLIDVICVQVGGVVIVDNASAYPFGEAVAVRYDGHVAFIQNHSNLGVAGGQNAGIDWARTKGANFVVLFDQDSLPANDLIVELCAVASEKMLAGELVAAVGPTNFDGRWQKALPFVEVHGFGYRRMYCSEDETSVAVAHVISSGALIPMAAIDRVGGMLDELFIDYIDVEWGMRAARHGLKSYGSCRGRMTHSLGNSVVNLGGRQVTMHSPQRDYYLFRNAVWMFSQSWLPLDWKIAEGRRIVLRFLFYAIFGRPWLEQLSYMSRGILDGLRGRTGIYKG